MEKIKGFQISSMIISGFKCYEEPTEITFGNTTVVTGGNGRGKSSLADAIAFAVTGLPFFGERGIDRLHNETNPDLQITMRFTDDTGKAHELTRSRQKDRMSITYDGYAIRQTDLNEMFGERDVFLSIFNPLYFIEELGEDGKKLLERYLPPVHQTDVLPLLNEQTQQRLSGLKLLSPETFLKNRREEIRALEQDAVYLSGKLDLAQKQRQSSKELFTELTAQVQDLQREIASLEARRFERSCRSSSCRPASSTRSFPAKRRKHQIRQNWTQSCRNFTRSWVPGRPRSTSQNTQARWQRIRQRCRRWGKSISKMPRF